jgi:NAD-dependent dihydropyrimidine dehydrogenase PreA subunit
MRFRKATPESNGGSKMNVIEKKSGKKANGPQQGSATTVRMEGVRGKPEPIRKEECHAADEACAAHCPAPALEACFLYAVADLRNLARDYPSDAALLRSIAQFLDGASRLAIDCLTVGPDSSARS